MSRDITNFGAAGRKIALFPGAFRPPHVAHYVAVCDLVARHDIDEVVIIITNRARNVPGTTKVLDTQVAVKIWSLYLRGVAKVRVEVAPGSAVRHALGYFDRVAPGDQLLFCVGEADFADGDVRFDKIGELTAQKGVPASTYAVPPTGSVLVRATEIRTMIARGDARCAKFMAAMPDHLIEKDREQVWQICRDGLRENSDLISENIDRHLRQAGIADISTIGVVKPGKTDPVFRVALGSHKILYVKYANDTVAAASFEDPDSLKPRQRLSAERRAIKWLRSIHPIDFQLPEVEHFDKHLKLLAMREVCSGGVALEAELRQGRFDPWVMADAAKFLASNHSITDEVPPFWGEVSLDKRHWLGVLQRTTAKPRLKNLASALRGQLENLCHESEKASERRYMHLDFLPKNILLRDQSIGVIDLELSSCYGDPAFDLGRLIGAYIGHSIVLGSLCHCRAAVTAAIAGYRQQIGRTRPSLWHHMRGRVLGFAGAALLDETIGNLGANRALHVATAQTLLGLGVKSSADEPLEQLIFGRS